jgi:hypothetical protein
VEHKANQSKRMGSPQTLVGFFYVVLLVGKAQSS